MNIIITGILGVLTTGLGSFITFFITRKKYHTEVDNNLIDNMQESLDFYKKLSDDNTERLDVLLEDNQILRVKFEAVLADNTKLRLEMEKLRKQIVLLEKLLKKQVKKQ